MCQTSCLISINVLRKLRRNLDHCQYKADKVVIEFKSIDVAEPVDGQDIRQNFKRMFCSIQKPFVLVVSWSTWLQDENGSSLTIPILRSVARHKKLIEIQMCTATNLDIYRALSLVMREAKSLKAVHTHISNFPVISKKSQRKDYAAFTRFNCFEKEGQG